MAIKTSTQVSTYLDQTFKMLWMKQAPDFMQQFMSHNDMYEFVSSKTPIDTGGLGMHQAFHTSPDNSGGPFGEKDAFPRPGSGRAGRFEPKTFKIGSRVSFTAESQIDTDSKEKAVIDSMSVTIASKMIGLGNLQSVYIWGDGTGRLAKIKPGTYTNHVGIIIEDGVKYLLDGMQVDVVNTATGAKLSADRTISMAPYYDETAKVWKVDILDKDGDAMTSDLTVTTAHKPYITFKDGFGTAGVYSLSESLRQRVPTGIRGIIGNSSIYGVDRTASVNAWAKPAFDDAINGSLKFTDLGPYLTLLSRRKVPIRSAGFKIIMHPDRLDDIDRVWFEKSMGQALATSSVRMGADADGGKTINGVRAIGLDLCPENEIFFWHDPQCRLLAQGDGIGSKSLGKGGSVPNPWYVWAWDMKNQIWQTMSTSDGPTMAWEAAMFTKCEMYQQVPRFCGRLTGVSTITL